MLTHEPSRHTTSFIRTWQCLLTSLLSLVAFTIKMIVEVDDTETKNKKAANIYSAGTRGIVMWFRGLGAFAEDQYSSRMVAHY